MINKIFSSRKSKIMTALLCVALTLISVVSLLLSGTLAQASPVEFTDPYPTYTHVEVGAGNATLRTYSGGYSWSVSDSSILSINTTRGDTVTVTGLKAGATSIAVGTNLGLVRSLNYQITDSKNITSYTLTKGDESYISKKDGTAQIAITTEPEEAVSSITWRSLNTNVASIDSSTRMITAVAEQGAAIIMGEFTDKWGVSHYIPYLVTVGNNKDLRDILSELISTAEGLDENDYTSGSWTDSDIENIILSAKDVLENPDESASKDKKNVQDAIDALKEAISMLAEKDKFIFAVDTSLGTLGNTLELKISPDANNKLVIDWGDGTKSGPLTGTIAAEDMTHTYAQEKEYTITISGNMPKAMSFDDESRLVSVDTAYLKNTQTNMSNYFRNCTNLASIPSDLFANSAAVTRFSSVFENCSSLTEIPQGMFVNNPLVTDFWKAFIKCTSLTTIPEGLFDNNTQVTSFTSTFNGCGNITSIPEGLFDKNTQVTSFEATFKDCENITSIPDELFDNNSLVTNFSCIFWGCRELTAIPEGLFDNNTLVTTFARTFESCNKVDSIPEGLFDNNTQVTTFSITFGGTAITSIPDGLFDKNPLVTNFSSTFWLCQKLTAIPEGLFDNNPLVTNFGSTFFGNFSITTIPDGLFDNNPLVTDFNGVFYNCNKLTAVPLNLFVNNTAATSFDNAFIYCSRITSGLPELWNTHSNAAHNKTFFDCCNAANYKDACAEGWA